MSVLQALGDSFTCGEGVGVRVPLARTWTGLLAAAAGHEHVSLAVPGAKVADVVSGQLPLIRSAAVSTLLVGLNDAARTGFDRDRFADRLRTCVAALRDSSGTLLLGRVHDPSRLLWMPAPLRHVVGERLRGVNAAVDELGSLPGVVVLDLEAVPGLRQPGAWAVDRVHPSLAGHAVLASEAARLIGIRLPAAPVPRGPGALARARWSARHGAPYLAGQLWGAVVPA